MALTAEKTRGLSCSGNVLTAEMQRINSVLVIRDSGRPLATVNPDFYEVNTEHGSIKIKPSKIAELKTASHAVPLTVTYMYGAPTNSAVRSASRPGRRTRPSKRPSDRAIPRQPRG